MCKVSEVEPELLDPTTIKAAYTKAMYHYDKYCKELERQKEVILKAKRVSNTMPF